MKLTIRRAEIRLAAETPQDEAYLREIGNHLEAIVTWNDGCQEILIRQARSTAKKLAEPAETAEPDDHLATCKVCPKCQGWPLCRHFEKPKMHEGKVRCQSCDWTGAEEECLIRSVHKRS